MKESSLIEMRNKVESLARITQQIIFELEQIKTLSLGNMELVKKLPGYEEAFNQLKEEHGKEDTSTTTGGSDRTFETDQ